MREKTVSRLAISSILLSASSIFLWVFWIPGVICGHVARAKIKDTPNLKGKNIALAGLVVGYFFPAALLGIALYLSGYLEREVPIVDEGRTVWEGNFPHDANEEAPQNRSDIVLIPVVLHGTTIGTVESRKQNLRLVLKLSADAKEITIWEYQDYGAVSKITIDEIKHSMIVYYDHTLIREKNYNTVVSLTDFKVRKYLINRGEWCF
jgi:hypothetical protein